MKEERGSAGKASVDCKRIRLRWQEYYHLGLSQVHCKSDPLSVLKQERVVVNSSSTASAALKLYISDPDVAARGRHGYMDPTRPSTPVITRL